MEIRNNPDKIPGYLVKTYLVFISLAFFVTGVIGCQDSAVGIANSSIIPDSRFTASSHYGNAHDTRYSPKNARLNGAARGWGPRTNGVDNDYLQIDLGQLFVICAVATQGCSVCSEWTTEYKISISVDNNMWNTYKAGGAEKLFPGNTDSNTVVKNVLDYPVLVRYIRFKPTNSYVRKVLRVEAYGLRRGILCSFLPVGIGSGKIPDSDMTASSSYNSTTSPSKARLNYTAGSSWCAATSDSSPYVQINLGSPYIICGIATQGEHMTDQWVQSYNMLKSNNGSTFTEYRENSQVKSFPGNFDPDTAVKNLLYDGTVGQYIRVAPTSHYGSTNCMRTELYGIKHDGGCTNMFVGIQHSSIIPDHRFTASSMYSANYKPSNARLNGNKAWTPWTRSGAWLQIDLGSVVFVCAVATQGSGYGIQEWVKEYKIEVSLDNVNWSYYQENNADKTFTGNSNKDDVVTNSLTLPVKAKFLRFYPTEYNGYPTMRVEVYGISSACGAAVGLEAPGSNQKIQMTASSQLDNTHTASYGRLYGNSAWCSSTSSNTEYLQIDLGQVMTVTGIATQGDHTMDKWVTTYTISYSMNGNLWNTYQAGRNNVKILQGNSDKLSVRVQWMSHPLTSRHVRVTPQAWNTGICMRIELYGCDYVSRPLISGLANQNLTAAANSYVDLVCIVQDPLIQYIKWYTGNTDITSQSTGLVRGANGVKQSTLRVNYTSADYILSNYKREGSLCNKVYFCKATYNNTNTGASRIKTAVVTVKLDYPTTLAAPTVHDIKSTSVKVTWIQPALKASQATVTLYVLQCQNSTYTQTLNISAPATSHVITGLAIYTNYSVKIKAISGVGPGQWSAHRIYRTDSALPVGFPISITAEALSSQSIRVTWQPPTSGINGPFLGYEVFCISGSDRPGIIVQQTTHTFTGLGKWTVYNVTVVIRNDKGDGPINAYVIRRTLEDAPTQPRNFQVIVQSSTRVQLDWAMPNKTNGIIRGFKVRYEKTGMSSEKDLPGNTTLSHVLTGLDKCTQYYFKMLAYTIKDGPYTSVFRKTTAEDAPSAPTNFVANIIKPNGPSVPNVTLTWSKPVVCGDNVRYYNVSYKHSEDPTLKVLTVDKSRLTVTIPVWGGVTYEFRVRGVTSQEGPDTPKKVVVIPVYEPSVSPSNLIFGDVNKTTFTVSWDEIPRSKSNGRVIAYEVSQTLVRRGRARRSFYNIGQVKLMNSSCCSLYLHDLLVCAEYHISVKGYTSAGAGPNNKELLKTSAPDSPLDLTAKTKKKREVSLMWQKPDSVTEEIKTYTIAYEGKKDYNTSFVHIGSLPASSTSKEVTNLYPGTRYIFRVSATTACGKGDNSPPFLSITEVDAPPAPVVGFIANITAEVNNVTIWESSDINGQIKAYQIIVVKVDKTSAIDKTKLKSYEEAEKEKLNYYIAANIKEVDDKKFPRRFVLGDEIEYSEYKNAKLKSGTKYEVFQRALTQDAKKEYLAGVSTLVAKGEIPGNKDASSRQPHTTTTNNTCIDTSVFAVSLAFNVAFLIFIVLLVVYIIRLRKQLEEETVKKAGEKRPATIASTKDVYENANADNQEGLPMSRLPAQTGSTYEQIDLHGALDPSDVQTDVTDQRNTPTNKGGSVYESINEPKPSKPKPKPKPKPQIYETVLPESQAAQHPKQLQNAADPSLQSNYQPLMNTNRTKPVYAAEPSLQSTYQPLMNTNKTKPVYASLHTYGDTIKDTGRTQEFDI